MPDPQLPTAVVPTVTYGELHLESSWVPICLCNLSIHSIEIPTKAVVDQVMPSKPSATGSPPDRDFRGVQQQLPKGMDLGGPGPPRPWRMA